MKMILIGCESRDGSNYKNYISSLGDRGVISGRKVTVTFFVMSVILSMH